MVLAGACAKWPAMTRWRSVEYVKEAFADTIDRVARAPRPEFRGSNAWPSLMQEYEDTRERFDVDSFFDEPPSRRGWLVAASMPTKMADDIGHIACLPAPPAALVYAPRLFCGRRSYTDWHAHPRDDTFTCQILGRKEVAMLPPTEVSMAALRPVLMDTGIGYNVDLAKYPSFHELKPYRATLEPGDVLYIPVHWWHAVDAPDDGLFFTYAHPFASPPSRTFDVFSPHVREALEAAAVREYPAVSVALLKSLLRRAASYAGRRG